MRLAAVAALAAAASACWTGTAFSHVIPQPQFLPSGESGTVNLAGPNERDEPMTGFVVKAPPGLRIVHAHPADGWAATVSGGAATWTGGLLAPNVEATFGLELEVTVPPGTVTLETAQLYPGGERVSWPVSLTIVPGADEQPSQKLGWALGAALVGLAVLGVLVWLAWRRRMGALQER